MRIKAFLPHIVRKTPETVVRSPVGEIVHIEDTEEGLYVTMDVSDPEVLKVLEIGDMKHFSIHGNPGDVYDIPEKKPWYKTLIRRDKGADRL